MHASVHCTANTTLDSIGHSVHQISDVETCCKTFAKTRYVCKLLLKYGLTFVGFYKYRITIANKDVFCKGRSNVDLIVLPEL